MEKFLLKNNANRALAERVKYLISKHEDGGDKDQNLLKDADSISYMEINAPKHVGRLGEFTADEIRTKFDNMYDRISSEEAKKLAKPLYDKAINQLLAASKKKNK